MRKYWPEKTRKNNILVSNFILIWVPLFLLSIGAFYIMDSQTRDLAEFISADIQRIEQDNHPAPALEGQGFFRNLRYFIAPDSQHLNNGNDLESIEQVRDIRALGMTFWLLGLLLTTFFLTYLNTKARRPLTKITDAVEQLSNSEFRRPISIEGSEELNLVGKQLNHLRVKLEESEQDKEQFFRHISHEIKTPLTTIKEGSKLLRDGFLGTISAEQEEVSAIIAKATKELQSSIENLLNYNRAVSMEKTIVRENIDLNQIVSKALRQQRLIIKSKRLKIRNQCEPTFFNVDQVQFLAVFENLISNAIKFSPQGGEILLQLFSDDQTVQFTIQDNGPGIPETQKLSVFNAFFVGEQKSSGALKGTGLGLSIARQYIEMHQGTIEVLDPALIEEKNRLKGACFRVCLTK